ncbi:hypothetical protein WN944_018695 [Citrus x changshan-huyou]|uniref:Uncharacterized protein n=1 Tax=Citrus x changshan-huyou TaxID=2935761 RepID=A0AAP0LUL1_9ROSI
MAWSNVSKNLMSQIEQIEESRRCKVRIAEDWVAFEGKSDEGFKGVIGEAMKEEMDDMVKSVIAEIFGALSVHSSGFVS